MKKRKLLSYNLEKAITGHLHRLWCWPKRVSFRRWPMSWRLGSQRLPRWTLNNPCSYFPTQTLRSWKVCKDGWCLKVWIYFPIETMIYVVIVVFPVYSCFLCCGDNDGFPKRVNGKMYHGDGDRDWNIPVLERNSQKKNKHLPTFFTESIM